MVRTEVFRRLGGFREGLRAAEDTDFCWRLQRAGWTLELREPAAVEHAYRESIGALRRQWREYAAGRAWLAGNTPTTVPSRRSPERCADADGARRRLGRARGRRHSAPRPRTPRPGARDRILFLAIDLLLALEELRGLRHDNEPEAGCER